MGSVRAALKQYVGMTLHLMYASGARFAPGARVIARHAGWERWVIYEADSGNASDDEAMAPQDERFEEVWYYNTESGDSTVRVRCATSSMRMRARWRNVWGWGRGWGRRVQEWLGNVCDFSNV
jgi:hypothetical protein